MDSPPGRFVVLVHSIKVSARYGIMQSVLADNGGVFSVEETREVSSVLNMKVCTTAADCLFQE